MSFASEHPIYSMAFLALITQKYNARLLDYQKALATAKSLPERIAAWEAPFRDCANLTTKLEVRGTPPDERCIFISNHQNIAMDNILVNLALRPRNRYARPIIGANLAPTEILKDLYENFGCVIIGRDKKTNALAQYRQVKDALLQGDIWVASTRGRNKDGIISADSKILEYYSAFDVPFAPISISYEIEPTIGTFLRTGGKKRLTDSLHAHTGLMGTKGRTIVSFGPECDASQVQSEIRKNYVVQESHIQGAKYFVNGEAPTNAMILKQMDKGFPREAFKFYDGIVTSTSDFYGK